MISIKSSALDQNKGLELENWIDLLRFTSNSLHEFSESAIYSLRFDKCWILIGLAVSDPCEGLVKKKNYAQRHDELITNEHVNTCSLDYWSIPSPLPSTINHVLSTCQLRS